jgi:hypothetical protein
MDMFVGPEASLEYDATRVAEPAGRTGGVQSIQTPRLGEPPRDVLGGQGHLRDRVAAASEKAIDLEGRIVKDGVKKALGDRKDALSELVDAVRLFRKLAESKLLTLQGADFAKAVERLNVAIDRAEGLIVRVNVPRKSFRIRSCEHGVGLSEPGLAFFAAICSNRSRLF